MGTKRYRTKRVWHNTLVMVWATPFGLLPGIIVGSSTSRFTLLYIMLVLCALGLIIAFARDRVQNCYYRMVDDRMELTRNRKTRSIAVDRITDASLIDRSGARAYIRENGIKSKAGGMVTAIGAEPFLRYCTVDIGLTSYTLGFGRTLIDRLPQAKSDLVLLRMDTGEALLLSPTQVQDLVDNLSRLKFKD